MVFPNIPPALYTFPTDSVFPWQLDLGVALFALLVLYAAMRDNGPSSPA